MLIIACCIAFSVFQFVEIRQLKYQNTALAEKYQSGEVSSIEDSEDKNIDDKAQKINW